MGDKNSITLVSRGVTHHSQSCSAPARLQPLELEWGEQARLEAARTPSQKSGKQNNYKRYTYPPPPPPLHCGRTGQWLDWTVVGGWLWLEGCGRGVTVVGLDCGRGVTVVGLDPGRGDSDWTVVGVTVVGLDPGRGDCGWTGPWSGWVWLEPWSGWVWLDRTTTNVIPTPLDPWTTGPHYTVVGGWLWLDWTGGWLWLDWTDCGWTGLWSGGVTVVGLDWTLVGMTVVGVDWTLVGVGVVGLDCGRTGPWSGWLWLDWTVVGLHCGRTGPWLGWLVGLDCGRTGPWSAYTVLLGWTVVGWLDGGRATSP